MRPSKMIELDEKSKIALEEAQKSHPNATVRKRSQCILLNSRGFKIKELAKIFEVSRYAIGNWLLKWSELGLRGLAIQPGRGRKSVVIEAANETKIESLVQEDPLNLTRVCAEIEAATGLKMTKRRLKRFLKKKGYTYKRIRKSLKINQNKEEYEQKVRELIDLVTLHRSEYIELFFADESGFSLESNIPYGWQKKGNPLSTCPRSSKRLNVFGIMSPENELFSVCKEGSINSEFVIQAISDFANQRTEPAVIVLDNAKIHHSKLFQEQILIWKEKGVEIFYLPTYSPHLNLIETLWRKMKYEWLRPMDFLSWTTLKSRISTLLEQFGAEFKIDFSIAL